MMKPKAIEHVKLEGQFLQQFLKLSSTEQLELTSAVRDLFTNHNKLNIPFSRVRGSIAYAALNMGEHAFLVPMKLNIIDEMQKVVSHINLLDVKATDAEIKSVEGQPVVDAGCPLLLETPKGKEPITVFYEGLLNDGVVLGSAESDGFTSTFKIPLARVQELGDKYDLRTMEVVINTLPGLGSVGRINGTLCVRWVISETMAMFQTLDKSKTWAGSLKEQR